MAALERLLAAMGLDYGGIDFGLNQEGEILLFEANATMVVEQPDGDPRWDYRRAAVERIHAAVRDLLLGSAGAFSMPRPAAVNGSLPAGKEWVFSCSRWSSRSSCIGNSCRFGP